MRNAIISRVCAWMPHSAAFASKAPRRKPIARSSAWGSSVQCVSSARNAERVPACLAMTPSSSSSAASNCATEAAVAPAALTARAKIRRPATPGRCLLALKALGSSTNRTMRHDRLLSIASLRLSAKELTSPRPADSMVDLVAPRRRSSARLAAVSNVPDPWPVRATVARADSVVLGM